MTAEILDQDASMPVVERAEPVVVMQDNELLYVGGGAETGVLF